MHPVDKEWWITHSGDYVLGLMSNADRLVFERIMKVEPEVKELVLHWREILQPLSDALTPIEPPEYILPSLITNLPVPVERITTAEHTLATDKESIKQADLSAANLADGTAFMRLVENGRKSADRWRMFAGLATVACLFLGSLGWMNFQKSEAEDTAHFFDAISIVENASAQPIWIVDSSADTKFLRVTAVEPPEVEEGKVFELWMHMPDDGRVESMGVLPIAQNASVQFKARKFDALATSFSVSLEDEGGSRQSTATGPVVYRGLINLLVH